MIRIVCFLLLASLHHVMGASARQNGGNCVGTFSCRPRCLSFRLDRSFEQCFAKTGVFVDEIDVAVDSGAWNMDDCVVVNCTRCGERCSWNGDLLIRINEYSKKVWSMGTEIELKRGQHEFTFCSIYPCPKTECALPEQMGTLLSFEVLSTRPLVQEPIVSLQLGLSQEFTGETLSETQPNRIGPFELLWMDDPANCRPLSANIVTPVAPIADPAITSALIDYPIFETSEFFCDGDEYNPGPLPMSAPARSPSIVGEQVVLQLWFRDVFDILSEKEARSLIALTRTFLRLKGLAVERVVLVDQSLEPSIPVTENVTDRNYQGNIMNVHPPALRIQISVSSGNVEVVASLLRVEWTDYVTFFRMQDVSAGLEQPKQPNDGSHGNSKLLWTTLTLTLIGVWIIVGVYATNRHRRRALQRTRRILSPIHEDVPSTRTNPTGDGEGAFVNQRYPFTFT